MSVELGRSALDDRGFTTPQMLGFVGENGGFLRKDAVDAVYFGFVVTQRHCNPAGLCHGGWLATMADLQLLFECGREAGLTAADLVTTSLCVDYLGSARSGEWLESRAHVVRRTRSLIFVEGMVESETRPVLRMNGIYQIRQG